jgi:hypothetical protein
MNLLVILFYILEFHLVIVNGNETIKLISIVRVIIMGGHLWKRYCSFIRKIVR